MSTHKIGNYVEMAKIIFQLSLNMHLICSTVYTTVQYLTNYPTYDNLNDRVKK